MLGIHVRLGLESHRRKGQGAMHEPHQNDQHLRTLPSHLALMRPVSQRAAELHNWTRTSFSEHHFIPSWMLEKVESDKSCYPWRWNVPKTTSSMNFVTSYTEGGRELSCHVRR